MDVVYEDDGLWDELSHQQSREIEQHRARAVQSVHPDHQQHYYGRAGPHDNSSNPNVEAMQRAARRAADEVGRFTENVYRSTVSAYQNQRQRALQRNTYSSVSNNGDEYLDEFGIPTRDDPLLSPLSDGDGRGQSAEPNANGAQAQNQDKGNFVLLPKLRPQQSWGAVSNLDLYFSSLYTYYYHRGLVPIIGKGLVELVTLFLTLYLSVFLFAHVDWPKLATCIDEATCHGDFFEAYYIKQPIAPGRGWTVWNTIVRLYFVIFLAYGLFSLWAFWQNVQAALKAKHVFEDRLGIAAHKLEGGAVDWDRDVVQKLCELQESGEYRIAIHGQQSFDALSVAHRILRKENFIVALFNRNLLDLSVPMFGHGLFCASLEWSLYFCIFNFMFNHKFHIRPAFYLDSSALKRRFFLCGIAHALFMPFLLFFMMLHFGFSNAYDWKSTKQYLGPREWSLTAKWAFREFNELPHFFERRLAPSYEAAEEYLKLFGQSEIMTAAGRVLVFLGGSIGTVLFGFAAINDAILLHVKIADWNLLWYAAVAGIVYSAGKSMLPNGEDARPGYIRNMYAARDSALANVASHTHYYPDIWRGRGWDKINHKAFSSMFKFKAQLFLQEVLAMVLAPFILCVSLPRCADSICEFILAVKTEVPGAGEVCGYATFNFDAYSDETWEGGTMGKPATEPLAGSFSQSVLTMGFEEASKRFPKPKAKNGKMEKSFFSFKGSHPSWTVPESGQQLVDRVQQYQKEETAALTREQQLHIEAAARQLETLARLEPQKTAKSMEPAVAPAMGRQMQPSVNESHIPRTQTQAPADAGAGAVPGAFSSAAVKPPPPMAFSHLSIGRTTSEQEATPAPEADDAAPFALNLAPSTMSVSPVLASRPSAGALSEVQPMSRSVTGTSLALSADILKLLNMSSLETGSLLDDAADMPNEERQYMWLDRYHSHLAAQQRAQDQESAPETSPADANMGSSNIV